MAQLPGEWIVPPPRRIMPVGLAGFVLGVEPPPGEEVDSTLPFVAHRIKGEVLHSGCGGFEVNRTSVPPLEAIAGFAGLPGDEGGAGAGFTTAGRVEARGRVMELVQRVRQMASQAEERLRVEVGEGEDDAPDQPIGFAPRAGAVFTGAASAFPAQRGAPFPAKGGAPFPASFGAAPFPASGATAGARGATATAVSLEETLLEALRGSRFTRAYMAWRALVRSIPTC